MEAIVSILSPKFMKVLPRKGRVQATHSQQCLWVLESGKERSSPLQNHLEELLSWIESNADSLLCLRDKCSFDLFCGFSSGSGQGGFGIASSNLLRMGELGVDLILDLYPPTID